MRLILCGGGSKDSVKESYELFAKEVDGGKVIYIPIAWHYGNMEDCINWFRSEIEPYGIINIEQVVDPDKLTKEKLSEASGVFIGGGNTYQLLRSLKESPAFSNLEEYIINDGLVMGCSAGALIFGKCIDTCLKDELDIKSCNDENVVGLKDARGYNYINGYSILPHYRKLPKQYEDTCKRVDKLISNGNKLVCLPEETSLWVNGDRILVVGQKPVEMFDGVGKKIIEPNNEIYL